MCTNYMYSNNEAILHPNVPEESLFQAPSWAVTIRHLTFFCLKEYYSFQNIGSFCSFKRYTGTIPKLLVSTSSEYRRIVMPLGRESGNCFLVQKMKIPKLDYQHQHPLPTVCTKL